MATSTELNIARKNLSDVLGDSMKTYLENLNAWFKRKLNKEEFDLQARNLMKEDTVHLHNEFLLALIAKCQSLASSLVPKDTTTVSKNQKPSKVKKRPPGGRANLQQRFCPAQTIDFVPHITSKALEEGASPTPLGFVAREGLLPDSALVHGRMLVCAWETGLTDVNDAAVKLLLLALETQIKHILSLVIQQKKGYKLRERRFTYAAGVGVPIPYFRRTPSVEDPSHESEATTVTAKFHHAPSLRPSPSVAEDMAVQQDALGESTAADYSEPISLFDLRDTLMLHKQSIASHAVCAPTLERVLHSQWHPSQEDMDQEDVHAQEVVLKRKLAAQGDFHNSYSADLPPATGMW
ncbi:transcriptional adapter 1 [Aplysia californica]|uniref:Transcriptional adapter 1 n=1 Tax=Aplysia californica TaxID=6500 RepID=A0ABM0JJN9_APLCA|nr:transcriptional adapter 1 [Aplysia californica]